MALPFILAGLAVAAGGYGVKKGVDAKDDFDTAKRINEEAREMVDDATSDLELAREYTNKQMSKLGTTKFDVYKFSLLPFVEHFAKIKNIDFDDKGILNDQQMKPASKEELAQIYRNTIAVKEVVNGGIAALGSGGLAGLAAYGGAGVIGTASTGAGIAGLSGAAATNATLAWFGGGSLAAGGMGMAGGTAVLGGIVAGPVIAVGGMMMASKAEEAKESAYGNRAEARKVTEEIKTAVVVAEGIEKRCKEMDNVLSALDVRFRAMVEGMVELVSTNTDYSSYSMADKKGVFAAASMAKTVKNIMEAQLLNDNGSLTTTSLKAIRDGRDVLRLSTRSGSAYR